MSRGGYALNERNKVLGKGSVPFCQGNRIVFVDAKNFVPIEGNFVYFPGIILYDKEMGVINILPLHRTGGNNEKGLYPHVIGSLSGPHCL